MKPNPIALIIDDDKDICSLLATLFSSNKVSSWSVHSIEEAKNALVHFAPEYIILDINLPDGNGLDFISFLTKYYPMIKVILCTGDYEEMESGELPKPAFGMMKKPHIMEGIKLVLQDMEVTT